MIPRTLFAEDHEIFRQSVQRFIAAEITPHHAQWEKAGMVPRELWIKAGQAGLLCSAIPETYGGMGGSFLHSTIMVDAWKPRQRANDVSYWPTTTIGPDWRDVPHPNYERHRFWRPLARQRNSA